MLSSARHALWLVWPLAALGIRVNEFSYHHSEIWLWKTRKLNAHNVLSRLVGEKKVCTKNTRMSNSTFKRYSRSPNLTMQGSSWDYTLLIQDYIPVSLTVFCSGNQSNTSSVFSPQAMRCFSGFVVLVILGRPSVGGLWTPIQCIGATQNHRVSKLLKSLCFSHSRKETIFLGCVCSQNSGPFVWEDFHLIWLHNFVSAAVQWNWVGRKKMSWLCIQVCVFFIYIYTFMAQWRSYKLSVVFHTVERRGQPQ